MRLIKALCICFCAWCALMAVRACSDASLEFSKAVREDCLVGDGTPPKYSNDPARKPFSFRKQK